VKYLLRIHKAIEKLGDWLLERIKK